LSVGADHCVRPYMRNHSEKVPVGRMRVYDEPIIRTCL